MCASAQTDQMLIGPDLACTCRHFAILLSQVAIYHPSSTNPQVVGWGNDDGNTQQLNEAM